jgi:hypothetical protein
MSVDLRTELNDCDNVTGFTDSNKAPSLGILTGQRYEGTGNIETQHTISVVDELHTTQLSGGGATFSLDLSVSTIYVLVKDNLVQTFANEGQGVVIGDGTNLSGYAVGGNDAPGLDLKPYYRCFKLDVSVIVTTPGTFTDFTGTEASMAQTTITQLGISSEHLAKAQGNISNVFVDRMTHVLNSGFGLQINGGTVGTPETMADVVGDDATSGWGMINNPFGTQYSFFAPTQWGEPIASADAYFTATDEQWFWLGDNNGGHVIGAGNFNFALAGNATNTLSFVLTRVVIVNTGARAAFDLSDVDVDFMQLDGCVFTDLGAITGPASDVDKFIDNTVFNNCDQAVLNDLDMDNCTFNGTTDALGAILWDTAGDELNQLNLTFNSDGTGHAIEISLNTASLTSFSITGYTVDGYETVDDGTTGNTVFLVDNALNGDVDIAVNGGTGSFSYERAAGYTGTVSIVQSVTVRVEGVSEGTAIKVVAAETAGTLTLGDTIFEDLADANGAAEITSFNFEGAFGAGLAVIVRTRNQGFPNGALQDDNGSYTDFTTESNSSTTDDMVMYPATPVVNEDSFQFGHSEEFGSLKLELGTIGTGGFGVTWEYWNGAWTALSGVVDGTSALTATGENIVSWTIPGDWAAVNDGGFGSYKYVRVRYTSGTMTIVPLGRKAKLNVTKYLPFTGDRTIVSTGLTVVASWVEDTIASF